MRLHSPAITGSLTLSGSAVTTGDVGIGQGSPAQPLHVFSSGNGGLEIDATGGAPSLFFDIPGNEQGRIRFLEDDTTLGGITYETNGTDYIAFNVESNTERMRIAGSGYVGIGSSAPTVALDVSGSSNLASRVRLAKHLSGTSKILQLGADRDTTAVPFIGSESNNAFDIITNNTQRVRFDFDGKVAIGHTSPDTLLHLKDASSPAIRLEDTTNTVKSTLYSQNTNAHVGTITNHSFIIDTNNTAAITIDTSQNLTLGGNISGSSSSTGSFGRVRAADKLAVGTGTATSDLHVFGTEMRIAGDTPAMVLQDTSAFSAGTGPSVFFQGLQTGESLTTFAAIQGQSVGSGTGALAFKTRNSGTTGTKMYLDEDGALGIGTESPTQLLHIHGGSMYLQTSRVITWNNGDAQIGAVSGYHFKIDTYDGSSLTEKLRVTSEGNILFQAANAKISGSSTSTGSFGMLGVGTGSPDASLKVTGPGHTHTFNTNSGGSNGVVSFIDTNDFTYGLTRFYIQDANNNASRLTFDFRGHNGNNKIIAGTSAGNVGIGETSPGYPLEVVGATGNTVAKFGETMALHMIHNAPVIGFNLYYDGGYKFGEGSSSSYGGYLALSPSTGNFVIATSNAGSAGGAATMTERVNILNNGNVGIGHSNPNVKLQVMGNTTISGSESGNLDFIVRNNHATALARAIVQNNNTDQNIIMFSDDANGHGSIGSSTGGSNNIRFKVGTDAYFEGGKFGINAVNPQYDLHVSGSGFVGIAAQSSGSAAGMFSDDNNGRSYIMLDDNVSGHSGFGSGTDYTSFMRQNAKTTLIAYGTTQGFEIGTHGSDEIDFITNNTRRMTIEAGGDVEVVNALSKGSGTFRIPHPVPEKKDKLDLQHSFVESPTRGDNIYRWQVEVQDNQHIIELPDYYQYLNENDMVWVNPVNHFGRGYGNVNDEQTELTITTDTDGLYNVLLIGTRKDETAMNNFKGIEVERKEETFKGAEPLENKTK